MTPAGEQSDSVVDQPGASGFGAGRVGPPTLARALPIVMAMGLALGAGVFYGMRPPDAVPPVQIERGGSTATLVGADRFVVVHVAGAVERPGLVLVTADARVADAIEAAGGALRTADIGSLNLAATVGDGDRLFVPIRGAPVPGTVDAGHAADGRVRINVADAAELERLPGVGPVLAARILAHRETHGPFSTVEDLLAVPGIGEGKLAALRDAVQIP